MFCSSSINGFSLLDIKTENWTVVQRVVEAFRCFSMNKQQVWPDSTTFWTFSVSSFFYTHSKTDMWAVKWTSMFKHGVGVGPHVEPCGVGGFGSVPIMSDLTGVQSVLRFWGEYSRRGCFYKPQSVPFGRTPAAKRGSKSAMLAAWGRKNQCSLRFLTAVKSTLLVESEKYLLRSLYSHKILVVLSLQPAWDQYFTLMGTCWGLEQINTHLHTEDETSFKFGVDVVSCFVCDLRGSAELPDLQHLHSVLWEPQLQRFCFI